MDPPSDRLPSASAVRRVGTWVRNKYQLDSVLGEGGMAVVYAATHRNKKRFAVKMLRSDFASAEAIRRFLREGYVANTVEHEDAVAVIDDDVSDDGSAFLVMELLDGESVDQLAERSGGRLGPRVVLAIAHQLLDVLAAAHAKGVVHRDIKPGNLFFTRAGRVKVLDFGIARLREAHEGAQATHTGVTMGTPSFMAPEQARGKASQVSERTDLWAAGATMFTLLSGRHVHEGDSPQELVVASATIPPRSLAAVSDAPEALVRFVDRALAFEPSDRWPSAAAMRDEAAELHVALFGEPAPRVIVVDGASVTVPASDPKLRLQGPDGAMAATVAMASKTERLAPIVQALTSASATTGEPVALAGASPAPKTRRAAGVIVAVVALACAAVAAAFIAGRTRELRGAIAETPTATASSATATAISGTEAPSAIATQAAPPEAAAAATATSASRATADPSGARAVPATSHTPTAVVTAKRPPTPTAPRATASARASDWDRQ